MDDTLFEEDSPMTTIATDSQEPVAPTEEDSRLARESIERLARLRAFRSKRRRVRYRVETENGPEDSVAIPAAAAVLLERILAEMAQGNSVTLMSVHAELTTQQAADILKVSRPFLVERLEKGEIPFRLVGTHRRIRLADVMRFKEQSDRRRLDALEKLAALDQALGRG
jgi:excisionase family DNA binding protein